VKDLLCLKREEKYSEEGGQDEEGGRFCCFPVREAHTNKGCVERRI
jgi:hypothetical protein